MTEFEEIQYANLAAKQCPVYSQAIAYTDLALSVIPVHGIKYGNCTCRKSCGKNAGKHPDVGGTWKRYVDNPAGPDLVRRWFRRARQRNVAIICGEVSGIIVVDADGEDGVAELHRRGCPETWTVKSGSGGLHAYFRHPGFRVGNRKLPGIGDLRGDGGYVVAPPSRHISGERYEWRPESSPWDVELAEPPEWLLLEKAETTPQITTPQIKAIPQVAKPELEELGLTPDLSRLSEPVRQLIRHGNRGVYPSRSEADWRVCVAMFEAGYGTDEVWMVMTNPENGISEKFYENSLNGERYLDHTISKAHVHCVQNQSKCGKLYAHRSGRVTIG